MVNFPTFIFIDDSTIKRKAILNQVRSEMSSGPVKTRPINSVPMFNYSFSVSLNKAKFQDFRTWYANDIYHGSSWFLLKDPLTGSLIRCRFAETEIEWAKMGNLLVTTFLLEAYDEL